MIRAFKKKDNFIAREMKMLDQTTLFMIADESCKIWFNLRIQFIGKVITAIGIVSCLALKGTVNNITLSLMITYTLETGWL